MVLVYCEHIGPRHDYIFDLIFKDILGIGVEKTSEVEKYLAWDGPKFSYARQSPDGGILFRPAGLLEEKGIHDQQPALFEWNGCPVGFRLEEASQYPFDPFSHSFYLVTRYEEYLPFEPDPHLRFPAASSLSSRYNFLDRPLVNILAAEIWRVISGAWPGTEQPPGNWNFVPTFDIDIAYAHLGKGFIRTLGGFARLLANLDLAGVRERVNTMAGRTTDPYDSFAFIQEILDEHGIMPIYFFLLGDRGPYDRNLSPGNKRMEKLIRQLAGKATVGIHPSYGSYLDREKVMEEISRLEGITGKAVTASRQHFLRISFPESYRILAECGITDDHSMGYSTVAGFRAAVSSPHYFYDLMLEKVTSLRIHPFVFMDSALIDQMKLDAREAGDMMRLLAGKVMKYGGEAVGIWHNYALSEKGNYQGAREQFMRLINFIVENKKRKR